MVELGHLGRHISLLCSVGGGGTISIHPSWVSQGRTELEGQGRDGKICLHVREKEHCPSCQHLALPLPMSISTIIITTVGGR